MPILSPRFTDTSFIACVASVPVRFLEKGKPRIGERTSFGHAKNRESAKNEARGRGRGEKGTLASNHCESQIRPLGAARFSDFDEMTTVENTQSKFGGRNTGGSKQTIVPCEATREFEGFSQVEDTDLQIALNSWRRHLQNVEFAAATLRSSSERLQGRISTGPLRICFAFEETRMFWDNSCRNYQVNRPSRSE